jgi:hypothetical protein
MTESLKKRESARRLVSASRRVRPKEFDIKLSEHHLQDTVRDFCLKNVRKGREKMDVCMERMIETGVVSEDAYNRPDAEATVRFLFKYLPVKPGFNLTFFLFRLVQALNVVSVSPQMPSCIT